MGEDDRSYPSRPICGVGIIAFQAENVLLVQRGKEPRRGEWSIPGGAVELGETVREAAVREFHEECGGEVELRDVADAVDVILRDDTGRVKYQYAIVDFWGEWRGGALEPSSDAMNARWVAPDELDGYALPPVTRAVIDKALAAYRAK